MLFFLMPPEELELMLFFSKMSGMLLQLSLLKAGLLPQHCDLWFSYGTKAEC